MAATLARTPDSQPTPVPALMARAEEIGMPAWLEENGITPAHLRALAEHTQAACARLLPPLP